MLQEIILDEHIVDDGSLSITLLRSEDDTFRLVEGDQEKTLSVQAIQLTMERYARTLEDTSDLPSAGLKVGDRGELKRFRFRARVDADFRDYLVWCAPTQPPAAALARPITAALRYLADDPA